MQLRKVMRFVRLRLIPLLVSGVILVSPLSLCANAALWEGEVNLRLDYWGPGNGVHYQMSNITVALPEYSASGVALITPKGEHTVNGLYFNEDSTVWSSNVDVYIGGYFRAQRQAATVSMVGDPYDPSNYSITYRGTDGQDGEVLGSGKIEFSSFSPSDTFPHGEGISARISFSGSEGLPISNLRICPEEECGWKKVNNETTAYGGYWYVTSVRVVTSPSSAELDELNKVADELIAQNEILSAMKGDIVSLLKDIYRECGDMNIAIDAVRTILTVLVEYADKIEKGVVEINTELDNIYSFLSGILQNIYREIVKIYGRVDVISGQLDEIYNLIDQFLYESDGEMQEETNNQVQQGTELQEGLGELQKPAYEDFDFNTNDYVDQFDSSGDSADAVSGFLGVIFGNSMISSMLMITLSFAMVAYVLYGKR